MRVLIVDDSATNLVLLAKLVRSIGCTPLTYSDPTRALQEGPDLRIDLAIVDYKMPKLDGIELIAKLRALPSFGDLPIVMVTTSDQSQVRYSALEAGATDFLKKPIDAVEVKSRLRNLMKLREAQNKLRDRASWLAGEVRKATHTLAAREQEIIFRLSRATEYRDTDTGSHIVRMARYCRLIAEGMGLDEEVCRTLYLAAPMHDVGKIAVSDAILFKPGELSQEERAAIEQHTIYGNMILAGSDSELIKAAAEIAISHHERWDGTGYPRGLRGTEIPLLGRIAAVADVFDALTTERPYKRAWSADEARARLQDGAGKQFDPECVSAFLARWDDVLAICADDTVIPLAQLPVVA
jgi:response regulator RpfG family c-di-GMP phosphodiesterase